MTRLDRYLLREVALPSAVAFAVLLLLILSSQAPRAAGLGTAAAGLLPLLLPSLLVLVTPIALLLGTLIGLGRLAEDGELLVIRAGGVAPGRLCRGPLVLALALTAALLAISVELEPASLQVLRERLAVEARARLVDGFAPGVFNDPYDGTVLYVGARDPAGGELRDVMFYDGRDAQRPRVTFAARGRAVPDPAEDRIRFVLEEGSVHGMQSEAAHTRYRQLEFERYEFTVDVGRMVRRHIGVLGEHLTLSLPALLSRIAASEAGRDKVILQTALHRRFALPFATLLMALIALSLTLRRSGGGGGRASAFGFGIVAAASYYLLWRVGDALAEAGQIPALLGAWTPNVVGGVLAIVLLRRATRPR